MQLLLKLVYALMLPIFHQLGFGDRCTNVSYLKLICLLSPDYRYMAARPSYIYSALTLVLNLFLCC